MRSWFGVARQWLSKVWEKEKHNPAIFISSLALIVAAWSVASTFGNLYQTHLRPFELVVSRGPVTFFPAQPGGPFKGFAVHVPLAFKNLGSRPGALRDVILVFHGTNDSVMFSPIYEIDFTKWLKAGYQKLPSPTVSLALLSSGL